MSRPESAKIIVDDDMEVHTYHINILNVGSIITDDMISAWLKSPGALGLTMGLAQFNGSIKCILHDDSSELNITVNTTIQQHHKVYINNLTTVDEWVRINFIDFCLNYVKLKYKDNSLLLNKFTRYYESIK